MQRHSRSKGKHKLLGSHQKCWVWGRNAILETLDAGRWPILELFLSSDLAQEHIDRARSLADRLGIVPDIRPPEFLTRLCHTTEHQGYLARMTDFPYWDRASVLRSLTASSVCVVLDGIQDPFNFGAMVRSAEVFGIHAVFIAETGQVGVTSMVVRSSAGAVNRLPIVRVGELERLVGDLRTGGLQIVAASEKADVDLQSVEFTHGTAVIIGNEGRGVRPSLLALSDLAVRIPQSGHIGSLNATVAASVFFYEAMRQRRK